MSKLDIVNYLKTKHIYHFFSHLLRTVNFIKYILNIYILCRSYFTYLFTHPIIIFNTTCVARIYYINECNCIWKIFKKPPCFIFSNSRSVHNCSMLLSVINQNKFVCKKNHCKCKIFNYITALCLLQ